MSNPFIFDDEASVADNRSIQEGRLAQVLFPEREVPTAGRPLINASLALNYAAGGLDVTGYRTFNLAVHVLCALMLFGCVRLTFESPRMSPAITMHAGDLAFGAALIWAVHPLNSEVVDYVTQRTESMMALCYLATIYAAARGWQTGAVIACALGMTCKESMVTAPAMAWLYDRVFRFDSAASAWQARWRMYVGLAATWGVLAAVTWSGPRIHTAGFGTAIDPWTYLLNQTVMITHYLKLAVWPRHLVLAYGTPQPVTLAAVLPQAIFVSALLVATLVALYRLPPVGFAGAWFFVTLAPTSSIVPIATEVGAERRMYLALAALTTLFVVAAWMLWKRIAERAKAERLVVPLVLVVCALGSATMIRNREYASRIGMARTVVARWPTDFAHAMLGSELAIAGQRDEAIAEFRVAAPTLPIAAFKLGMELYGQRKIDEAIVQLESFLAREPLRIEAVDARTTLGRSFMLQRRWPQAIEQFQQVLKMTPERHPAHVAATGLIGDALFGQDKFAEAVPQYRAYLAVQPADGGATTNLARALFNQGDLDGAMSAANALVRLPGHEAAGHNLLGRILATRGQLTAAAGEFNRAVQLAPGDPGYRQDLDTLTAALGGRRPPQ